MNSRLLTVAIPLVTSLPLCASIVTSAFSDDILGQELVFETDLSTETGWSLESTSEISGGTLGNFVEGASRNILDLTDPAVMGTTLDLAGKTTYLYFNAIMGGTGFTAAVNTGLKIEPNPDGIRNLFGGSACFDDGRTWLGIGNTSGGNRDTGYSVNQGDIVASTTEFVSYRIVYDAETSSSDLIMSLQAFSEESWNSYLDYTLEDYESVLGTSTVSGLFATIRLPGSEINDYAITQGTVLVVVPEPSALIGLVALGGAILAMLRRSVG